ncbi:MAG TPA: amidohydrolase [Spirochaetales bacterium]|nr:amidohydrolase [Spirochaetales bacterium]HRY55067.1 amidohydrolase [Spirochaetia bacterium]HRZ64218.1 amidohydrolase [Spirochaetia bacterium]
MTASIRFDETRLRSVLPRMIELRRELHRVPELGRELPRTAELVEAELRALGLSPRRVGCGMWADVGSRGPLVALRADMDALPVAEASGASYASATAGRMHACGHDAHAAALLGAARLLAEEERAGALPFRARLVFQTGEESEFGALPLIEAEVLEGVAAIAAGHVGGLSDELEPGQAGFLPGPMMAAGDRFEGAFVGSGGHGSAPHQSPDPVSALAEYVLALGTLRARELDQTRPSVISICSVRAGSAHNVIPERAEYMGTARSLHPDLREKLERRSGEIAASIAAMRGLKSEFRWLGGYPPLVNDEAASLAAEAAARALLGAERVVRLSRPIMGAEDFSYYLEKVPGCFWFLNTQAPERGICYPNHNPRFDLDESLLWVLAGVNLAAAEALAAAFAG